MSKEREAEIIAQLGSVKEMEPVRLFMELISLRRERHRDRLEKREGDEFSGRALECKDLLHIFG